MTSRESKRLRVLVVVLALGSPLVAGAQVGGQSVPEDDSWTTAKYAELGLPDPGVSWTTAQYQTALQRLSLLPRRRLPRLRSKASGLMFNRMLLANLRVLDLTLTAGDLSLAMLYGLGSKDSFLFDRELVAIRAAELSNLLPMSPTAEDIRGGERVASILYEQAESAEQQRREAERLRIYSALLTQSSALLQSKLQALLYLLSLAELGTEARADAMTEMGPLAPLLKNRLVRDHIEVLSEELAGLGRLDWNHSIRNELADFAAGINENP